jgi:hypothetical protein
VWLRRARLWSVANILPTATAQGASRKHRLYSENVIFLTAILFRISDLCTSTDILRNLSENIQWVDKSKGRIGKMWRRIKGGNTEGDSYLLIRYNYTDQLDVLIDVNERNLSGSEGRPAIYLNLTAVLEELSAVADEEGS